jgi:Transposase/Domain of unknown function (DUF1508)
LPRAKAILPKKERVNGIESVKKNAPIAKIVEVEQQHAFFSLVVDGMGSVIRRRRSRHTMSALVCGLDVHKDSTYATILDHEGKIVNQARMENEKVPSYLAHYGVKKVAMESSTAVAPMYRQLKKDGFDAVVSHPKKTKLIAEAKIKSDRVD